LLGRPDPNDVTFSICVHEEYVGEDGEAHDRFGVAVTTRLPGVGALCPFASENAAVATQSYTNVELGRKGVEYVDDGLAVGDALEALLNADEGRPTRQLHGVDAEGTFAFSGDECGGWYGHVEGDGHTVAGNLLVGEEVVDATAAAYEAGDRGEPLARRLVDALEAGYEAGGDAREDLEIQSAALLVETTEARTPEPYYRDLRVDASRTPVEDLRSTYEAAREGYETALRKYYGE
jgi:uncharacterized Ntn-hydrolase superfamily protein